MPNNNPIQGSLQKVPRAQLFKTEPQGLPSIGPKVGGELLALWAVDGESSLLGFSDPSLTFALYSLIHHEKMFVQSSLNPPRKHPVTMKGGKKIKTVNSLG